MSDEGAGNNPISVTLKAGSGYDAPWVVFRGDNPEEIYAELSKLENDEEFLRAVVAIATSFKGLWVESSGASSPAPAAQGGFPPQRSGPAGPTCSKCGSALTWQTWAKKDGSRTFEAWKCPSGAFGHDVDWKTPRP